MVKTQHKRRRCFVQKAYVFIKKSTEKISVDFLILLRKIGLCVAVDTAVDAGLFVLQAEMVVDSLLGRGNATRIFTGDNVGKLARKRDVLLLRNASVLDENKRDITAEKANLVKIDLHVAVDLDNVLLAHLLTRHVL